MRNKNTSGTRIQDHDSAIRDALIGADIGNEKARAFFEYVFGRTLSAMSLENDCCVGDAVAGCARLLTRTAFPFKKSNGTMLFIPSAIILEDLLYSDMAMTLFFMKFVEFHLLLMFLKAEYPDFFRFIAKTPCPVPASLPGDADKFTQTILREYFEKDGIKNNPCSPGTRFLQNDPMLLNIIKALVDCRYLPFAMDYTAYNKEIIAAI